MSSALRHGVRHLSRRGVASTVRRWSPSSTGLIHRVPSMGVQPASVPFVLRCFSSQSMEFQAETRQLLDIVTNSLYTDKEVFLRELVSNASDALEKLRLTQNTQTSLVDSETPLEIRITTDEENKTLTIADTGIGMSREEMVENLGTIARSGSKAFLNEMEETDDEAAKKGIIGKFGVGFYSAFMVGEKVEVRSKSAVKEGPSQVWISEGTGTYEISEFPDEQGRGASIVIHLKKDEGEFSKATYVEEILKKYSNFVNFPIFLNDERVNTMEAIWSKDPKEVDEKTYTDFYQFMSNAYDTPLDQIHFRADAPLDIKALLYIPSFHGEKYGMGRMEPGVSLYSRKVLIEAKSPDILPEWMRFVRGAVDSEDLPLSVSREKAQDSRLISKLRNVLTRKFVSHLSSMAKKDPEKYEKKFFKEYGFFIKEGVCQDFDFQEPLSKLLLFETSKSDKLTSLDEYVSRCTPEQKDIYYLCAPSRELALQSPYLEAFIKADKEVIFVYTAIDDFVMGNLEQFQGRKLVTAEKDDIDLGDKDKEEKSEDGDSGKEETLTLSQTEADEFCAWFQMTMDDRVSSVKTTTRLGSYPAVVTNNESGAMRRMMRLVETQDGGDKGMPLPKQQVEINPKHPLVVGLNTMRSTQPELAQILAEQIFDNCLIAAGILDDGRSMLPRLNDLLLKVVEGGPSSVEPTQEETPKNEDK